MSLSPISSQNSLLRKMEDWHNWASDKDFVWFPFVFLKLRPDQVMTFSHRLKMTCCFTPYGVIFYVLRKYFLEGIYGSEVFFTSLVTTFICFFLWFNFITAPFWNRRAHRLRENKT